MQCFSSNLSPKLQIEAVCFSLMNEVKEKWFAIVGCQCYCLFVSFADDHSWGVDEMGRSAVLWLDFRSDSREKKTDVEVSKPGMKVLVREKVIVPLLGVKWPGIIIMLTMSRVQ